MREVPESARLKVGKDLQFAMHLVFIFLITVSSVSGIKVWLKKQGFMASEHRAQNARVFWPQNALAIFPSPPVTESEDAQDQDPLPGAFVATSAYQQAQTQQLPVLKYNRSYQPPLARQRLTYRQPVYRKAPLRRRAQVKPRKPQTAVVSARPQTRSDDREYSAYMSWVKQTLKTYQQGAD